MAVDDEVTVSKLAFDRNLTTAPSRPEAKRVVMTRAGVASTSGAMAKAPPDMLAEPDGNSDDDDDDDDDADGDDDKDNTEAAWSDSSDSSLVAASCVARSSRITNATASARSDIDT